MRGPVRVECARVADRDVGAAVRVPCLHGVGLARWLSLVERGAVLQLVDRGWCQACPAGAGLTQSAAHTVGAQLRALLTQIDWPAAELPRVLDMPTPEHAALPMPDAEAPVVARRAWLSRLGKVVTGAAPVPVPTLRERNGSPMPLPAREALAEVLQKIASRTRAAIPPGLFAEVSVSESCGNEQACVAACPTGALQVQMTETADEELRFSRVRCIACGACERACPRHALRLSMPTVDPAHATEVTLRTHRMRTCARCRARFASASEVDLCPRCERERAMSLDLFANKRSHAVRGLQQCQKEAEA